jgi:phosphatidylcholine synthase
MQNTFTAFEKLRAGSVHLFTSFGIVAGFLALLAISQHEWQMAALWLGVAQIIDGIDGTFARKWRVKEVLPNWDGESIDYVVDFTTYAVVPAYFMYEAQLFPPDWALPISALVLLTSAMYYGKSGMVSDDLCFVGFPVMWNVTAIFVFFVVHWAQWANAALVVFLCICHFVPIKFPYPSRGQRLMGLTIAVSVLAVVACTVLVYQYPAQNSILQVITIATALYYWIIGIYNSLVPSRPNGADK